MLCIAVGCTQKSSDGSATTVATAAVGDSAGATPSVPDGWVDYTDPSGVKLAHPQDWTVQPGTAGPLVVFVDPANTGTFRRNINGLLQRAQAGQTLDQYIATSKKGFDAAHANMISEGPTTFSGTPAYQWRYELNGGGHDLTAWGIVAVRSDGPWLFTYTADSTRFDEDADQVRSLYDSIVLPQ
jgi:hypothetical protein